MAKKDTYSHVNLLSALTLDVQLVILPFREVSLADVTNIEKRLMQTMDMIIMKKKRIAISRRQKMSNNDYNRRKQGIWGMIYSGGSDRNQES